ncbi:hypothetical protein CCACVL1_15125 [Corchorus capsularis]|uniref:Uncharacterized protein n=1 Tax=Corchorus capsularis TaxID=210143 RepID=A0A1R3I3W3_COCAP|nr:hypothetical protein CCACVL1_15125 [Corchorus capsularis]
MQSLSIWRGNPQAPREENEFKESVEEYEKDERLELDDNEYEPEEYSGVDYDEKEMDPDEVGAEENPEEKWNCIPRDQSSKAAISEEAAKALISITKSK